MLNTCGVLSALLSVEHVAFLAPCYVLSACATFSALLSACDILSSMWHFERCVKC